MSLLFASGGQSIGASASTSLILTWTTSELQSSPSGEAQTSLQLRLKPLKSVWGGGCEARGSKDLSHKKNSTRGTVVDKK